MRKLVLLTMAALAMAGVLSSTASAAVEVRNSNGELCGSEAQCQITVEGTVDFSLQMAWGLAPIHHCDATYTVDVSGDGSLVVGGDFDPDPAGGAPCRPVDQSQDVSFCNDDSLVGQILAPGDDGYVGEGEFDAWALACWEVQGHWNQGLMGDLRFGVDSESTNWDLNLQQAFYSNANSRIHGSAVASDALEITAIGS